MVRYGRYDFNISGKIILPHNKVEIPTMAWVARKEVVKTFCTDNIKNWARMSPELLISLMTITRKERKCKQCSKVVGEAR